jgi:hypothetical protein
MVRRASRESAAMQPSGSLVSFAARASAASSCVCEIRALANTKMTGTMGSIGAQFGNPKYATTREIAGPTMNMYPASIGNCHDMCFPRRCPTSWPITASTSRRVRFSTSDRVRAIPPPAEANALAASRDRFPSSATLLSSTPAAIAISPARLRSSPLSSSTELCRVHRHTHHRNARKAA